MTGDYLCKPDFILGTSANLALVLGFWQRSWLSWYTNLCSGTERTAELLLCYMSTERGFRVFIPHLQHEVKYCEKLGCIDFFIFFSNYKLPAWSFSNGSVTLSSVYCSTKVKLNVCIYLISGLLAFTVSWVFAATSISLAKTFWTGVSQRAACLMPFLHLCPHWAFHCITVCKSKHTFVCCVWIKLAKNGFSKVNY